MSRKRKQTMVSEDFGLEAKQDSSLTLPLTIIGVTLLLCFGFVYYYFGPTISELRGNTPDPSASSEKIPMTIGDVNFLIPTNYTLLPKDRRAGQRDVVALYALLPEFAPYSMDNAEVFDNNEPDSPVLYFEISAYMSALEEEDRLEKIYLENVMDRDGRQGPYGFTVYEFVENSGYKDEDLFVARNDDGSPIVIRCYRQTEIIPSPHCRRDFRISDSLALSYRYKRPWLAQWEAIDQNLTALALGLRASDAELRGIALPEIKP